MNEPVKILMLEDMVMDAELATLALRELDMQVSIRRVETRAGFVAELDAFRPDVILSDFSLPTFDGMSALAIARDSHPDIPFIFVSGTIGDERAINALKCGAIDYVLKDNLQRLAPAVRRALQEAKLRAAQARAESRFRDLIEYAPHAIMVFNQDGMIEIVNEQVEILFGYDRAALIGKSPAQLMPDGFSAQADKFRIGLAEDKGRSLSFETDARTRSGGSFPAEVSLSPLNTEGGLWIASVIRDLSERKAQDQRLSRMTRIRTILGNINSLILRIRDKQRLLEEACRVVFDEGKFAGTIIGLLDPVTSILVPVAWEGMDTAFLNGLSISANESRIAGRDIVGASLRTQRPIVTNDISNDPRVSLWRDDLLACGFHAAFVVPLVVGGKSIGIIGFFGDQAGAFNDEEQRLLQELAADLSFALEYIGKEEQINYLAYFDALTGLPNRTLFRDRLGQLIAMEQTAQGNIVVVLVDLERFRNVNDTLGRAGGDELLREVARRLRDAISDPSYLARINADCFAFVVKESTSHRDVINLIERTLAIRLSGSIQLMNKDIRVSLRAGMSVFPLDGTDADTLLRNAEVALKQTKMTRARTLFYAPHMNARTAETLSIESRLRRAVEEKQFELYYQPKVDVVTGQIVGLEALLRWNEPGVGVVMPGTFIHVLEDTGLIIEVGTWVIGEAHRQFHEWKAKGIWSPRIAVNVSQLQIKQKTFVGDISRMLPNLELAELEIEITESLFMEGIDQQAAKRKLAALREMGITVAIDDFGTGYSSLSYIARLPIDTLKIDRSFIMSMDASPDNMAIVSTIISLAHALKLKVVAEGVETERQLSMLTVLECDQIQGFLYSRALPAAEMAAKLLLQQSTGSAILKNKRSGK